MTRPADILLDVNARPVIGHRGASAYAPENTLPSFALAQQQGCDAFECDVHLSKDGVPVVIHDPTLARTTDRDGVVAEMTVAELKQADAGARFTDEHRGHPFRGRGVTIPTLRELLEAFPAMPVMIEIKAAAAQDAVAETLLACGASDRCVLASFAAGALDALRRPPFLVGAASPDIVNLLVRTRLGLWAPRRGPLFYAVPDHRKGVEIPTPRFVRLARGTGRPVHVWTVDDLAQARTLWARGVSGMITNRPGPMRALRDTLG